MKKLYLKDAGYLAPDVEIVLTISNEAIAASNISLDDLTEVEEQW